MRIKIIAILYVGNFNNITLEHIDSWLDLGVSTTAVNSSAQRRMRLFE